LNVTGEPQNTKLETELPTRPAFVGNFLSKTEADVQRRFVLESDPDLSLNRDKFINGTTYRYCQLDKICILRASVADF